MAKQPQDVEGSFPSADALWVSWTTIPLIPSQLFFMQEVQPLQSSGGSWRNLCPNLHCSTVLEQVEQKHIGGSCKTVRISQFSPPEKPGFDPGGVQGKGEGQPSQTGRSSSAQRFAGSPSSRALGFRKTRWLQRTPKSIAGEQRHLEGGKAKCSS